MPVLRKRLYYTTFLLKEKENQPDFIQCSSVFQKKEAPADPALPRV